MRSVNVGVGVFAILAAGVLTGCNGSSSGGATSDPSAGVYAGQVLDESGQPVKGAQVSVAGILANGLTGSDGRFVVEDPSLKVASATLSAGVETASVSEPLEIAINASGYEPLLATLLVEKGGIAEIDLVRSGLEPQLTLTSPTGERPFVIPTTCQDPRVLVEGFVNLGERDGHRLDIVIVVDSSGSTGVPAFDLNGDDFKESVLEVEIAAVRCFVEGLDRRTVRVSLTQFADDASEVVPFTGDLDLILDTLSSISDSTGGTNFESAFSLAREQFLALEAADAADALAAGPADFVLPTPERAVLFVTDGIPTARGVPRDTTSSNMIQSFEDRQAAIDGAKELGSQTGAKLFAYSILPARDTNNKRTTLPHCVAACGGGRHVNVENIRTLSDELCGTPMTSLLQVTLRNLTLSGAPVSATVQAGGFFSALVSVGNPAANQSSITNTIEATATAFSGALAATTTASVTIKLIDEAVFESFDATDIASVHTALAPVSASQFLKKPSGGNIPSPGSLWNLLVGPTAAQYEDAYELHGVETFRVVDQSAPGADSVVLDIDFVFNRACYRSDFGYIVIDPNDPPESAEDALLGLDANHILFNSGDISASNCDMGSVPAGVAHYTVTVDTGNVVAFFILPNRTLANYKSTPRSGNKPLFTLSSLNPGSFDEVLTFKSANGRTVAGSSTAVVTPGPLTIFAFEDISAATKGSDQDYDDVVFTVRSHLVARIDEMLCED